MTIKGVWRQCLNIDSNSMLLVKKEKEVVYNGKFIDAPDSLLQEEFLYLEIQNNCDAFIVLPKEDDYL